MPRINFDDSNVRHMWQIHGVVSAADCECGAGDGPADLETANEAPSVHAAARTRADAGESDQTGVSEQQRSDHE
jgi:hypothetical protein